MQTWLRYSKHLGLRELWIWAGAFRSGHFRVQGLNIGSYKGFLGLRLCCFLAGFLKMRPRDQYRKTETVPELP